MQLFKSGRCRKRRIQTIGLIVIIIIIYFMLQLFSLSKLGHSQGEKKKHFEAADVVMFDVEVRDDANKADDKSEAEGTTVIIKQRPQVKAAPRGVHPSDANRYAASSAGMFMCLESKLEIPAERVNDDFCDCPDSSDEPGTSACPYGRFYCSIQLPGRDAQFVHSSKVNDGICDCCDGSDEWAAHLVPSPMRLNGKKGAVFHAPCEDRCGDALRVIEEEQKIQQQGVLLQRRYLEAARSLSSYRREKFGPDGIFYLLSKECFEHSALEYQYTVCPFESVRQSKGSVVTTVLGRQGQWKKQKSGDYVLTMGGGDDSLCPDGDPRQVEIRFLCGLQDGVVDIIEDQRCLYNVRFRTPAACR